MPMSLKERVLAIKQDKANAEKNFANAVQAKFNCLDWGAISVDLIVSVSDDLVNVFYGNLHQDRIGTILEGCAIATAFVDHVHTVGGNYRLDGIPLDGLTTDDGKLKLLSDHAVIKL